MAAIGSNKDLQILTRSGYKLHRKNLTVLPRISHVDFQLAKGPVKLLKNGISVSRSHKKYKQ